MARKIETRKFDWFIALALPHLIRNWKIVISHLWNSVNIIYIHVLFCITSTVISEFFFQLDLEESTSQINYTVQTERWISTFKYLLWGLLLTVKKNSNQKHLVRQKNLAYQYRRRVKQNWTFVAWSIQFILLIYYCKWKSCHTL